MKKQILTSLGLLAWVVLVTLGHGINTNTVAAFILALPVIGYAMYLIWIDSRKPFEEQWRYVNRRKSK